MPGRREKTRCLADVTVWHFANASEPIGRLSKGASDRRSIVYRMAAEAEVQEVAANDTDVESDNEAAEEASAENGVGIEANGAERRVRKRRPTAAMAMAGGSVSYPVLLWQLLGEYIHPESVGAFAALCRGAHRVTRTRAFWRGLYLRWAWGQTAAADEAAPHELRRDAVLVCHQRVRPRVIRALHRWHFVSAAPNPPPAGLRFLRFAVRGRRLLVLFRRGPPPPPPRPVPDSWEAAAAADDCANNEEESAAACPDHHCPTEGQWLLMAELEGGGGGSCSPACLEELLALDSRYVLAGFRCLTVCSDSTGAKAGAGSGGRWCELLMRAPHNGETRAVGFACAGAPPPRLLPWWRPGFLPALRE